MDTREALFITSAAGDGEFRIEGKVKSEESNHDGGEHAYHQGQRSDSRKYYKTIATRLLPFDDILIFGPGKAQEELRNFLQEDTHFKSKRISIDSANQLTDPQLVAKVKGYFGEE